MSMLRIKLISWLRKYLTQSLHTMSLQCENSVLEGHWPNRNKLCVALYYRICVVFFPLLFGTFYTEHGRIHEKEHEIQWESIFQTSILAAEVVGKTFKDILTSP